MQELKFEQVEDVNGGGTAKAVGKVAKVVAKYAPHPIVKGVALVVAAGAAALAGYENNKT